MDFFEIIFFQVLLATGETSVNVLMECIFPLAMFFVPIFLKLIVLTIFKIQPRLT